MKECKPLLRDFIIDAATGDDGTNYPDDATASGRGLLSSTFQLNLSNF